RYSFMRGILNQNLQLQRDAKFISGDPQSRRVKIVCKKCNNEWMSVLQEHTKPVVLPLLKGDRTVLDRTRQNILAAWAAMTVICAEYIEPTRAAMAVVARRHLFKNKQAPDCMRIWIGDYQRNRWPVRWVHNSLLISEHETPYPWAIGPNGVPRPNTQITTFVLGRLYLHAFSCPFEEILRAFEPDTRLLAQIWHIRARA